jgi:flagellar motor switch protein FliG
MATLNKLITMNDTEIQRWLKKVEKIGPSKLAIALIDCNDGIKRCVLKNMSQEAGKALSKTIDSYKKSFFKRLKIKSSIEEISALF